METRYKSKKDENSLPTVPLGKLKLALNKIDIIKRLEKLTGTSYKGSNRPIVDYVLITRILKRTMGHSQQYMKKRVYDNKIISRCFNERSRI